VVAVFPLFLGTTITMDEAGPWFTIVWINVICAIFSSLGAFIYGFDSGTPAVYLPRMDQALFSITDDCDDRQVSSVPPSPMLPSTSICSIIPLAIAIPS
jgi:hypothetical protein